MKYIKIFFLVTLLLLSVSVSVFAQTIPFKIYRYNKQNKLEQELTKAVGQDRLGIYYLATDGGLLALINDSFKKIEIPKGRSAYFKNISKLSNGDLLAISDDAIYKVNSALKRGNLELLIDCKEKNIEYAKSVFEDKHKRLWIADRKNLYQMINGKLHRYNMPKKNKAESYIRSYKFLECNNGLFVVSEQGYFYKYHPVTNKFNEIYNSVSKVYDKLYLGDDTFLLGTSEGLAKVVFGRDGKVLSYRIIKKDIIISSLSKLSRNKILLGTWFNGLWELNLENNNYNHYDWSKSITVNRIFKDQFNHYWIATNSGLIVLQKKFFKTVGLKNTQSTYVNTLRYNNNEVYFATNNSIYRIDSTLNSINLNFNVKGIITSFNRMGDITIIGTNLGELYRYKGSKLLNKYNLGYGVVFDIELLDENQCWVVANRVLFKLNFINNEVKSYKSQFFNGVSDLLIYGNDFYVGGDGFDSYLHKYNPETDTFINISTPLMQFEKSDFCVRDIEIVDDTMYICSSLGLIKYNLRNRITVADNIFKGEVNGVAVDCNGSIYVTTSNGVVREKNNDITIFTPSHGLLSKTYTSRTMQITRNGLLFIGSASGVSVAKIDEVIPQTPKPLMFLTNKSHKYIEDNSVVEIKSNDMLLIDVASTINPKKDINFEYCLKSASAGKCTSWRKLTNKDQIIIPRLSPKKYILSVRCKQNGNYLWSDVAYFTLHVEQVWYFAWYTILIVVFLILFLLYTTLLYTRKRAEARMHELEKLVDERTQQLKNVNSSLQEANIAKDKFLSIIGHDLRNPFHAIRSFAQLLSDNYTVLPQEEKLEVLDNIYKSADDTYNLLENLLEWARMQKGELKLNKIEFDIREVLQENIDSHNNLAGVKNIVIVGEIDKCIVFADREMISTVVRNLLSNAIKYSNHDSEILIRSVCSKKMLEIEIRDYGVGMTPNQLERLFKIDEVQSTKGTDNEEGTGFGLLLSKEFIEKHKGNIRVESVKGKGTSFFISLRKEVLQASF